MRQAQKSRGAEPGKGHEQKALRRLYTTKGKKMERMIGVLGRNRL